MHRLFGLGIAMISAQGLAADSSPAALRFELNAIEQVETGCRLSFVAENGLSADIGGLVLETVFFDPDDRVTLMTMLDFGALPHGRSRVRQFALAGQACSGIGQILFNGVESCDGAGITPDSCEAALTVSSRTEIGVAR
ncbi:hypothetical protein [Celeribacter neptunius]|uniref:Uncharacterized protein n=1 Tax=Celeribacter neptunius TaxID=588602 RepID=A0A1I3TJD4_9RHOB|nr:hypothetical protein [Celeribacter neptunius]SFJ69726.1 hypothetical protein SAMN04487991_2706 [Celeribacter neptunius]